MKELLIGLLLLPLITYLIIKFEDIFLGLLSLVVLVGAFYFVGYITLNIIRTMFHA